MNNAVYEGKPRNRVLLGIAVCGVLAVASVAPVHAAGDPNLADLMYDPATGNVAMDQSEAAGGIITNFVLENAAGGADFNTGVVVFPFIGPFWTDTPTEISQTDPLSSGFTGGNVHYLGNIFPTGYDLPTLTSFLTVNSYVGQLGSGVQNLEPMIVPEPATVMLLVVGGAGLILQRRRSAR